MHNNPQNNLADVLKTIAAFLGAGTGTAAFIWNIVDYYKFELEIYSHSLSATYSEKASKLVLKISQKDLNNFSDDAIVLTGWFKLLLRKEGKRYKNHRINLFDIEPKGEFKKLLKKIMVDSASSITLFCDRESTAEYPLLPEGKPFEVKVHSNHIFFKRGWKTKFANQEKIINRVVELVEEKNYKIDVHLTTYKYPFVYKKRRDTYFYREHFIKRMISSVRRSIKL